MVINSNRRAEFVSLANYAVAHKAQYQEVERATRVPWAMVAVIHRREGNGNFGTYLGNGQSLAHRTTIVPRGRGPFSSFLVGAIDALKVDGLTDVIDWRLEKQLYWCTGFNGWGYWPRPSPYIFGGTSIQVIGKYTSDNVYDGSVWDTQPGCAPMLAEISALDHTVKFVRETPMGADPPMVTAGAPTTTATTTATTAPKSKLEEWFTPAPPAEPPAPLPTPAPTITTATTKAPAPVKTALTAHQVATIRSGVHNLIKRDMNTLVAGVVPTMFQSMAAGYEEQLATQAANDITTFIEDQFK